MAKILVDSETGEILPWRKIDYYGEKKRQKAALKSRFKKTKAKKAPYKKSFYKKAKPIVKSAYYKTKRFFNWIDNF